ncbi:MAG: universal stress protein [Limisphaerales bacterium]
MKIKPANRGRGVAIELSPKEKQIPTPATPFKLSKILVPVDFSTRSRKAVDYAMALARQFSSEVILLNVVQPYMPVADVVMVDTLDMIEQFKKSAQKDLEKWRNEIDPSILSRSQLRSGEPYHEIVQAAKDLDVDLIVISTHGRTGLAHTFLGSTSERVIRHAGCPVLVVRERQHDFVLNTRL